MTDEEKLLARWIDNATYKQLLERWRNAPSGDRMFVGSVGDYYGYIMAEQKRLLTESEQVKISKEIGWNGHKS